MSKNKENRLWTFLEEFNYDLVFLTAICWALIYMVYYRVSPAYGNPDYKGGFSLYSLEYFIAGSLGFNLVVVYFGFFHRFRRPENSLQKIIYRIGLSTVLCLAPLSFSLFYMSFYGHNLSIFHEEVLFYAFGFVFYAMLCYLFAAERLHLASQIDYSVQRITDLG